MSADDAVAKAKAIAAKLSAGTGFVSDSSSTSAIPATSMNPFDIAKAAEAALAGLDAAAAAAAAAATTTTAGGGAKRKRWGMAPEAEDLTGNDGNNSNINSNSFDSEKRVKKEAQKRLWISTSVKPASHYRLYWEEHGASISRQVSAGEISLSLQGRGSSPIPALPGIPEQPLHILIEGPTIEACENAEPLVEALFVMKANEVETLEDANEPNSNASGQTDSYHNSSNASAVVSSVDGYKPAPVASLIHNNPGIALGATLLEEQIGVPNGIVGFIIGRGGESIASMQARTGCKVQIQKENEMQPGQTQRVITLQAATKEAIDQCRSIIQGMVNERTQQTTSSREISHETNSQEAKLHEAIQAGHVVVTVAVPDNDVGLIIGKAGSTIKGIQDRSGANIQIPQTGDVGNPTIRTVSITHPHVEGARLAKQMIEDILGSKRNQAPHITIQVEIPDKDVGMCIGRAGCVIREMQNQSGAKIQIPSFSTPGMLTRIATVTGPAEGCERVKQMIERIVLEQSSQSVMSGMVGQGMDPYGQGYVAASTQQYGHAMGGYGGAGYGSADQLGYNDQGASQDYSKEWAAYYAAQAAAQASTGAADAGISSYAAPASTIASYGAPTSTVNTYSAPASTVNSYSAPASAVASYAAPASTMATPAPAPATQPAADAYYEEFFRYAYYYGEESARAYYGAWSPPPGTPNPYGTNPNGITPAPAPAQDGGAQHAASAPVASNPVPAPAPVQASVRDSGRRGVSNLPAWMTKG